MGLKFSIKLTVVASLVYVALNSMWVLYNSFVPLYLQGGSPAFSAADAKIAGFGLGAGIAGLLMTLDNVAAIIIGPFIGLLSDSSKSRWGRRKPFILGPMLLVVLGLIAVSIIPQQIDPALSGQTGKLMGLLLPFIGAMAAILVGYAVMYGPSRVILFDITPSKHRVTASGISQFLDGTIMIIVSLTAAALFAISPSFPFRLIAAFIVITVILVCVFVREPKVSAESASEGTASTPGAIVRLIRSLPKLESRSLIFLLLTFFFTFMTMSLGQAFWTSYAVTTLKMDAGSSIMLMAMFAVAMAIFAIPSALFSNRLGRKRSQTVGLVIGVVACLVPVAVPGVAAAMAGAFLIGVGFIIAHVNHLPMLMDSAPSGACTGTYMGMFFTLYTLGLIVGPITGGAIIQLLGNNYAVIWPMMAVCFALAFVALRPVVTGEVRKSPAPTEGASEATRS